MELLGMQLNRNGIELEIRREAFADRVMASSEQLKGVLINLFLNAADAMPRGGVLRIWTHNDAVLADRPGIKLHLADNGAGISPELRDRIFDPFFTTKRDGSGIGLPLALHTLRLYGGDLVYEKRSEIEPGTEFIVSLPLMEFSEDLAPISSPAPPRGKGRYSSVGKA
jgi:signal transduction histidine kinase